MKQRWARDDLKLAAYEASLSIGCTCEPSPNIAVHGSRIDVVHLRCDCPALAHQLTLVVRSRTICDRPRR